MLSIQSIFPIPQGNQFCVVADLFALSRSISGSAGPIFTIFAPYGTYWITDDQSDPLFPIFWGTLPCQPIKWQKWGKITYPLHLSLCHHLLRHKIGCHGNVPWGIGKKWTGLTTFMQIPSIWWKDRENQSSIPRALLNLKKEKKEINASKIYSPVGRFAERAK